jgi:hypothetical protein
MDQVVGQALTVARKIAAEKNLPPDPTLDRRAAVASV